MQLALALTQTRVPSDGVRAQALIQRVLANTREEVRGLHPLAWMLASRYNDQKRLEEQIDKQNQQLRDNQRRIDQLNERLEAVRAIERSLTARPSPPPASAPANGVPRPSP
jgi:DNA repair ATPase RecN